MEAYWRRDYGNRLQSLEIVDAEASIIGENVLFGGGQEVTKAAAWRLGASSIEWLTLNGIEKKPEQGLREKFLFSGLASKLNRSYAAGWIDEIEQVLISTGDFSGTLVHCMDIADWIAKTWKEDGMSDQPVILALSNRLHVLRFLVAGFLLARSTGLALGASRRKEILALLGDIGVESCAISVQAQQKVAATLQLGLSLCESDLTQRGGSADEWQHSWNEMCAIMWKELCRSR